MQNLQTVIATHYPFDFGISARLTLDPDALQVHEGREIQRPWGGFYLKPLRQTSGQVLCALKGRIDYTRPRHL